MDTLGYRQPEGGAQGRSPGPRKVARRTREPPAVRRSRRWTEGARVSPFVSPREGGDLPQDDSASTEAPASRGGRTIFWPRSRSCPPRCGHWARFPSAMEEVFARHDATPGRPVKGVYARRPMRIRPPLGAEVTEWRLEAVGPPPWSQSPASWSPRWARTAPRSRAQM